MPGKYYPRKGSPSQGREGDAEGPLRGKRPSLRNRAVELLAEGKSPRAVAEELGVCSKTVYNWMHDPKFAALLYQINEGRREAIRNRLHAEVDEVMTTLFNHVKDPGRDSMVVVKAAEIYLDRIGIVKKAEEKPDHDAKEALSDEVILKTLGPQLAAALRRAEGKPDGGEKG